METFNAKPDKVFYNEETDNLYVGLTDPTITDEEEVAPGIHVLYRYDKVRLSEVVAVEIEYFRERFGSRPTTIEISGANPFLVAIP